MLICPVFPMQIKGTGLGLSVSYGIIKKHHGEIQVESQPGEGATFTVLMPIKNDEKTISPLSLSVNILVKLLPVQSISTFTWLKIHLNQA